MPRNKLEMLLTFNPYIHVLKESKLEVQRLIYLQHIANQPYTFTDDKVSQILYSCIKVSERVEVPDKPLFSPNESKRGRKSDHTRYNFSYASAETEEIKTLTDNVIQHQVERHLIGCSSSKAWHKCAQMFWCWNIETP